MPELPEVETTRKGIEPFLLNKKIFDIKVHTPKLRWPIPIALLDNICNREISAVIRRGKYILIYCSRGYVLIHLGMSGSLRISNIHNDRRKHDHVEFILSKDRVLRFNDPRRFGCILWQSDESTKHPLLSRLGPEPLEDQFNFSHLKNNLKGKKCAIKNAIMDSHVVVGVGNIYASESLFRSCIRPGRAANRLSNKEIQMLCKNTKSVLTEAIKKGGTTLKDFINAEGKPGYFAQQLDVYGRNGELCRVCGDIVKSKIIGQRTSFYCPTCQK